MVTKNITDDETSGETESASGLLQAIDGAIFAIQETLKSEGGVAKVSLPDLARLLQLRRELEGERPRRISVRWIDECKTSTD